MRPSEILERHRDEVRATIARFPVVNPRVFASVARGEDDETSDIDIIVDALDGATYYDLVDLEIALGDLLGTRVDVATPGELRKAIANSVLHDARPI